MSITVGADSGGMWGKKQRTRDRERRAVAVGADSGGMWGKKQRTRDRERRAVAAYYLENLGSAGNINSSPLYLLQALEKPAAIFHGVKDAVTSVSSPQNVIYLCLEMESGNENMQQRESGS
ncbi:hypothetical protein ACH5RR_024649 [Cinchona calisaya]|uniref:Uncharacterized protein n=1 Tax=Cinchona calisaya TaxID=153742 RepID=A0ABD2YXC0_9GENT